MNIVEEREKLKSTFTDKIQAFIYTVKDNADNWLLDELVPGFWSKISKLQTSDWTYFHHLYTNVSEN